MKTNTEFASKLEFIRSINEAALKASEATGLSYELMLSQAALETGWGAKVIPNTHNTFNIQADPSWHGPTVTLPGAEEYRKDGSKYYPSKEFRVYATVEEGLIDRVKFLQENPRYSKLFKAGILGDFDKEAEVLEAATYATVPNYAKLLKDVVRGPTMQKILRTLKLEKEEMIKDETISDLKLLEHINDINSKDKNFISSILNKMKDSMNALKDPLIIDLKNDGLNLSNPDNRYIESIYFDLNNDGIKEKTGWIIPKYEVINSTDGISKGFITNNSFYFEGDKEQSQQGWNISYSNITYNGIKQLINPVIDDAFLVIDKIMPQNETITENTLLN